MTKPKPDWVSVGCFGACFQGYRGMDRCAQCDGTGSQLFHKPTGDRFPNTPMGWKAMEKKHGKQLLDHGRPVPHHGSGPDNQ